MPSNQAENMSAQEIDTGVVNLSSRHLRRIERLPKGLSPSTLLLSNNEISKVENLQHFAHLQQLSLARNHIVDMRGISAAEGLRVLDLSNNSIVCIEGISSLWNLEWLNLSGNSIEEIANLDRNSNLNHVDLSDNSIAVISGLRTLKKLKTLLLHGNLISSLAVIKEQLPNTVCTLSLADNEISDLNEMMHLSYLVNLQQLSLVNNPCVLTSSAWILEINYRPYLVYRCPNLRNLDGQLVTNQERILARLLNQAFHQIGHPSLGQHIQLVSILHHICNEPAATAKTSPEETSNDLDGENLLESESFYIPVPPSDVEETQQTQSDDLIMTEEEAIRLFSLAATIIQAHVRGYLVRKKFDFCQYRQKKYAAACIQAAWKGYCARTKDIKVVNIRNELRVRRLISIINNLHSKLDREHQEAVKSREQLKTAIKYLWCQITEQRKTNYLHLHKKQVKAATKIQAWWRGYMSRKAFPRVQKKTNSDVSTLFSLCHKLQMQLDMVLLQIKEITKGEKGNEETHHEGPMVLDGKGPVRNIVDQQDSLAHNISSSTEGIVDPFRTSIDHQLVADEDKFPVAVSQQLDDAHEKADFISEEAEKSEISMTVSGQVEPTNDSLEPGGTKVPSIPDQMNQEMYKVVLANSSDADIVVNKPTTSDSILELQEVLVGTSPHPANDKEVLPPGPMGAKMNKMAPSASDLESLEDGSSASSSTHQDDLRLRNESHPTGGQLDKLEGNVASSDDLFSSVEMTPLSQSANDAPKHGVDAGEHLHVGIPEIIVSSPVPTDDESSNEGYAVDSDVDKKQMEVEQHSVEKQDIAEDQSDADGSCRSPSSKDEAVESDKCAAGTITDQTKNEQESGVSENGDEKSNLAFGSTTNSVTFTEASSGEEEIAAQAARSATQASVPNLGERASTLLSQLRSEIASMKTARLSGVLPNISSEDVASVMDVKNNLEHTYQEAQHSQNVNATTASPKSQELGTIQVTAQDHDIPQERGTSVPPLKEHETFQVAPQDLDASEPALQKRDKAEPVSQERDTGVPPSKVRDSFQVTPQDPDASKPTLQKCDTAELVSQESDTRISSSIERDRPQPGPVSAVTYRLPLFEDVDSTSTSFSLDDFISDPAIEDASSLLSDTGYRYDKREGAM